MEEQTQHKVYFQSSVDMSQIPDNSVQLVCTSPPYPLIDIWTESFENQGVNIDNYNDAYSVYEQMHQILDKTWKECYRILQPGCYLVINIGDALRNIENGLRLFPNHSRITTSCLEFGFYNLPGILWHKCCNGPNCFMGSGVLSCGQYVTLEHEYILVFKKPGARKFETEEERMNRRESAYFFEERNKWYSDIWEVKGTKQNMISSVRSRNASFPLEIPYRLINMFSVAGDTVVDCFAGLCTTSIAAAMSRRNSISYEIEPLLKENIKEIIGGLDVLKLNKLISERYHNHTKFMRNWKDDGKSPKYYNKNLRCSVISQHETDIKMKYLSELKITKDTQTELDFVCKYNENRNVSESPNEDALF